MDVFNVLTGIPADSADHSCSDVQNALYFWRKVRALYYVNTLHS